MSAWESMSVISTRNLHAGADAACAYIGQAGVGEASWQAKEGKIADGSSG